MKFGKEESRLIKGIAIQMMVFHHLIGFPEWVADSNEWHCITSAGHDVFLYVAYYCKICVAIYIFITGYSIGVQNSTLRMRVFSIWKLLEKYWYYFLIFIVIGVLFNEPLPPVSLGLRQMFGLSTATGYSWDYHIYMHPIFAWYISVYILFLLSFSAIQKLCTKKGIVIDFLIIYFAVNSCYVIFHKLNTLLAGPDDLLKLAYLYSVYAPIGALGYLFNRYSVFSKLDNAIQKYSKGTRYLMGAALIAASVYFRTLAVTPFGLYICIKESFSLEPVFIVTFIIGIMMLCDLLKKKYIKNILLRFQARNFDIWMLHCLFFTPLLTFQKIAYWGKHPLIIFVFSTILLLILSEITNRAFMIIKDKLAITKNI